MAQSKPKRERLQEIFITADVDDPRMQSLADPLELDPEFPEIGTRAPGVSARKFVGAPVEPPPSPLDPRALASFSRLKTQELYAQRAQGTFFARIGALFKLLAAQINALYPMRIWNLYLRRRGPLLAAGSAYRMFFSIAAMLVAGFAVLGLVANGNPVLRDGIIDMVAASTPGLIDTGHGGLAKPEQLLGLGGFGLTLVISLGALVFTSLGWLTGLREGIRTILGLVRDRSNPVVSKLRDALLLVVLAIALVSSSALAIASSSMIDSLAAWLGFSGMWTSALTRVGFVIAMFILDCATAWVLLRVASRAITIRGSLWPGVLLAGAGATTLRFFSAMLLSSLTNNVLLAPFAVILGLFVWFNLLSQMYLVSAAVIAVRAADLQGIRST